MKALLSKTPASRNQIKYCCLRRLSSSKSSSPKSYIPNSFEYDYYKLWMEKGCFEPKERQRVFSLILPPPNVTGTLHLGHALTISTIDTLARWRRMCGDEVVWVPGVDHAGIATQAVVEKVLEKQGISRSSIGREKFLDEVWKWKKDKGSVISTQMKMLGSSVDWSREIFTMDDVQSRAVVEALISLWNKGLVYRSKTLVNWSPHLQSTISDIEVNYVEVDGPTLLTLPGYSEPVEFGHMIDFAYRVVGTDEEITVSTSRIETIFGDVAVAVNPNDDRYRHLWGSVLRHPFTGREIPLVLDYNVDPQFGSGALKVTPAHDRTDFLIGKSHDLPVVTVINEEGILEGCGKFSGMKRFDARDGICEALAEQGLFRGKKPHKMSIPLCSRSGDVIEYLVKPQWFIKCKGMAEKAILAVKNKEMRIIPERFSANWFAWLENIDDWCISRQLWWGHRLPFYFCKGDGKETWFPARNEDDANEIARASFSNVDILSRDSDVLDTWFSSALLPFSSFGWPQHSEELKRYYPLSTLVTGNDILFFWVARMAMLGLELTGHIPFKEIFLHGIICDSEGRKMSKSLGNVIEPEDIVKGTTLTDLSHRVTSSFLSAPEIKRAKSVMKKLYPQGIPDCGVDALRFTLLSTNIKNQYVNFDLKECDGVRRFCNKLWQACNFTKKWLDEYGISDDSLMEQEMLNVMDRWILFKLNGMLNTVNDALHSRDFHLATNALRNFVHHQLCDIYIESIKPFLNRGKTEEGIIAVQVLRYSLESSIKCISPFMPFITEYLHEMIGGTEGLLMETSFPEVNPKFIDHSVEGRVSEALDIVYAIRRLKHQLGINKQHTEIWLSTDLNIGIVKEVIERLGQCTIDLGSPTDAGLPFKKEAIAEGTVIFIKLQDCKSRKVDLSSVIKRKEKLKKELEKLMKITSNEGYKNAPLQVQKSHQEKIFKLKVEIQKIEALEESNTEYKIQVSR